MSDIAAIPDGLRFSERRLYTETTDPQVRELLERIARLRAEVESDKAEAIASQPAEELAHACRIRGYTFAIESSPDGRITASIYEGWPIPLVQGTASTTAEAARKAIDFLEARTVDE